MAAAAQELPPFLPTFVINGMLELHNSSLDSAAAMKPTGIPIIRAGFVILS